MLEAEGVQELLPLGVPPALPEPEALAPEATSVREAEAEAEGSSRREPEEEAEGVTAAEALALPAVLPGTEELAPGD